MTDNSSQPMNETSPSVDGETLLPCPFCGGKSERSDGGGVLCGDAKCPAVVGIPASGRCDPVVAWNTRAALSRSEAAVAWRGSDDAIRNLIAAEIWAYQECVDNFGPFNEVSVDVGDMKALAKSMAIDEAERIRKAVLGSAVVKSYFAHHTTEDETYEIGKRDGYEDAIQNLDIATGGDGEFKGSTIPGETVDVPAMQARIIARYAAPSPALDPATVEALNRLAREVECCEHGTMVIDIAKAIRALAGKDGA